MDKKERLSAFNRENILCAAKQLFTERGIALTTMDDIAKEADYSKSTIYVYFKSKDEIYNNIVLEYFVILKDVISKALTKTPGFPEGYNAICNALAKLYDPMFFSSISGEIKITDGKSEDVLTKIYNVGEEINGIIVNYLKNCIDSKHICINIPPIQVTSILWAGIFGIISTAHKKEVYIKKAMGITKEDFMKSGFCLLLRSIVAPQANP